MLAFRITYTKAQVKPILCNHTFSLFLKMLARAEAMLAKEDAGHHSDPEPTPKKSAQKVASKALASWFRFVKMTTMALATAVKERSMKIIRNYLNLKTAPPELKESVLMASVAVDKPPPRKDPNAIHATGIGRPLAPSQANKKWTQVATTCDHPACAMTKQGGKLNKEGVAFKAWLCNLCGSRWERTMTPEDEEEVPSRGQAQAKDVKSTVKASLAPKCPECKIQMMEKIRRWGSVWGCRNAPECQITLDLQHKEILEETKQVKSAASSKAAKTTTPATKRTPEAKLQQTTEFYEMDDDL